MLTIVLLAFAAAAASYCKQKQKQKQKKNNNVREDIPGCLFPFLYYIGSQTERKQGNLIFLF